MGILHWFRFDNDYWDPGLHALGLVVAIYYPPGVDGMGSPVLYHAPLGCFAG